MRHHAAASYASDQLTGRNPGNIRWRRADDRIAQTDLGPARTVDVETQDARHLGLHLRSARVAIHLAVHVRVGASA